MQTAFRARLDPCFARQGSFKTHMGPSREPQGPPRDPCFARQGAFKTRMGPQAAHLVGPAPSANTLPAGCRGPKRPSKVMYFGVLFLKSVLVGFWGRFCSILRAVWHQFWITLGPFWHHFPGKIVRSIVFYSTSVPSGNSSADRADRGETVSGNTDQTDPPYHGQEFSDDVSSQQTPSNKLVYKKRNV